MAEAFETLLRAHRVRRRWSQEALGARASVSTRHVSCLETGKSSPSREMVLRIGRALELPLRARNELLVAAGYAAAYPARGLDAAAMAPVHRALDRMLAQQEPYGGILLDRCWNVLRMNAGAARVIGAFLDPSAVPPEVVSNLVLATMHPAALRPFIVNWSEVARLVVDRIERACAAYPTDAALAGLAASVRALPGISALGAAEPVVSGLPVAELHLRRGDLSLRLFTMLTTLGTPIDVTAAELTLESLLPADDATDAWFRAGV